jgi:hypothetical protein
MPRHHSGSGREYSARRGGGWGGEVSMGRWNFVIGVDGSES